MRPEGHRPRAAGIATRWCGLAGIAGGALLVLAYAVLVVRQALDWQAGPTLGTPVHLPLMRTISTALLLLIVGLLACWPRGATGCAGRQELGGCSR